MKMHDLIVNTFKVTRKNNRYIDMYKTQQERES
jgi:hypothetical protein